MNITITPSTGGSVVVSRSSRPSITISPKVGTPPSRKVEAGTGLVGGGDLSTDRTISLSTGSIASLAKADSAIQPTATDASSFGFFLDQDDLTDDDATKTASQQSIKANIDARSPRGRFDSVAAFETDTSFGYSGAQFTVGAGDQFEAGGYRYAVADAAVAAPYVQSANSVRAKVRDRDGVISTDAFGGSGIGARFNAALDAIKELRQNITDTWFPDALRLNISPGTYELDETLLLTEIGNLHVNANGVTIKNSGALPILKAIAASRCVIEGLAADLRNNNLADAAFQIDGGCVYNRFARLGVQGNTSNADFAAVRMKQGDMSGYADDDRNKGNFWNTFDQFWVRKLTGSDLNNIPTAFDLQGAQNATRIINSTLASFGNGIVVRNQNDSLFSGLANDVQVLLTAFEGFTGTAFRLQSDNGANLHAGGGSIAFCRFESGAVVADAINMNASPSSPIQMLGNTVISSVPAYVAAGSENSFNTLDAIWTPSYGPRIGGTKAFKLMNFGGAGTGATLELNSRIAANGGSLALVRTGGTTVDGQISIHAGGGMEVASPSGLGLWLLNLKSLSASGTTGNNLRGRVSNPASGTTSTVTFSTAEPDANYYVMVTGDTDRKYWVTSKATTGFTINTDTAFAGSGSTEWLLIR